MGAGSSSFMRVKAIVGGYNNLSKLLCTHDNIGFIRDMFRLYPELERYYRSSRSDCQLDRYIPYLFPDLFQVEILKPLNEGTLSDADERDVIITLCRLDFPDTWNTFLADPGGRQLLANHSDWLLDGLVNSYPTEPTSSAVEQQKWLWNYLLRQGVLTKSIVKGYLRDLDRRLFIMNYVLHDTDPAHSLLLYKPISKFLATMPNRERMDYMRTLRRKQLERIIPLMLAKSTQLDVHVKMFIDELYTRLTPLTWAYMLTLARATRDIYRPILNMFFIPLDNSWFSVFAIAALMGFIVTELSRYTYIQVGPNRYKLITYPIYRLTLLNSKTLMYAVHDSYLQTIAVAFYQYNEGFIPLTEEDVYFTPFFTIALSGTGQGGISAEDMLYNIRRFTDVDTIITSVIKEYQTVPPHVRGGWATSTVVRKIKTRQPLGIRTNITGG